MSRLRTLRRQLNSLRVRRAATRQATAWTALGVAVLWTLLAIFLIDFGFKMDAVQRGIVIGLGLAAVVWAFCRYTAPFLGVRESLEQVALLVERGQRIDSDLIAALQFEGAEANKWGSLQLEQAVVDHVAQLGSGLNVFQGFSREQMNRRLAVFAVTFALLSVGVFLFPEYARVFANRLCLGADHYPSRTVIECVVLNHRQVLPREQRGASPLPMACAEGRSLNFYVLCSGEQPDVGEIRLRSKFRGNQQQPLSLTPLSLEQRLAQLKLAKERIQEAHQDPRIDVGGPWAQEVIELARFELPDFAAVLRSAAADRSQLMTASRLIEQRLRAWPGVAQDFAVYVANLRRVVDDLNYRIYLGDAWTDSSEVTLIPLPAVEPRLTASPPAYARGKNEEPGDPNARQLAVLEGSDVEVAIECANGKQLTEAWLTCKAGEETTRYELSKLDDTGARWILGDQASAFRDIRRELRFEIQVTDSDDLHLETPIQARIRLRPDRPPSGSSSLVHKVVLPSATPILEYRVADDYGIAKTLLHLEVERREESAPASRDELPLDAPREAAQPERESLAVSSQVLLAEELPARGKYAIDLSPHRLQKGDRLKLTLEVVDYRGERPGESFLCDPLVVDISDESGVLAAIAEADERSEQQLTDIIKKQLGIGESP